MCGFFLSVLGGVYLLFEIVRKFTPPKTAPKSARLIAEWGVSFQEGDLRKRVVRSFREKSLSRKCDLGITSDAIFLGCFWG